MAERAVTRGALGAWVIKCNPATWDLQAFLDDGNEWIEGWSVGETYRNSLIEAGDLVVFWVSGTRAKELVPGIWGVGRAVSGVHPELETEIGYWRDLAAMRRVRSGLDVDIQLWNAPIAREELKNHPVLGAIEVLTMPLGSNPSYLTVEQWAALEFLLGDADIPGPPPREIGVIDEILEAPDPHVRVLIEEAAVREVWRWLDEDGWSVEDKQRENLGWDLTATRGSETALVEVKGRFGKGVDVLLSLNEVRAAREHENWELAVVTSALTDKPKMHWFGAEDIRRDATVALYRFRHAQGAAE